MRYPNYENDLRNHEKELPNHIGQVQAVFGVWCKIFFLL
jgi:hypothetical protein